MRENWDLVLLLVLYTLVCMGVGVWIGRRYERRDWMKILPKEMNELCLECSGIARSDTNNSFTEVP